MALNGSAARRFEEFRADSWTGWREVLAKLVPTVREFYAIAGRGSGKSRIVALLAACFAAREYKRVPGENIYIGVFAPDMRQATVTYPYVKGLFDADPELSKLVAVPRARSIDLTNGVIIEVLAASIASPRSRSYALVIIEEAAFLRDERSANPDLELLRSMRPGLARVPHALLCVASSPYARRGVLYDAWKRDHDGSDPEVLLVQAPTRAMARKRDGTGRYVGKTGSAQLGARHSSKRAMKSTDVALQREGVFADETTLRVARSVGRRAILKVRQRRLALMLPGAFGSEPGLGRGGARLAVCHNSVHPLPFTAPRGARCAARGVFFWVYPGFPTPFWGLSGFFVGDLIGKALWELVENAQRFPRHGGRVLCVHGAVSFHRARPCATRWLPGRGPMRDVELDRCVLGLQSTGEQLCSRQHRRPVHAERSIYPGKTGISGAYAIWETRI